MGKVDFKDMKLHDILSEYHNYTCELHFVDKRKNVDRVYEVLHFALGNMIKLRSSVITRDDIIGNLVSFYHNVLILYFMIKNNCDKNILEHLEITCKNSENDNNHQIEIRISSLDKVIFETMYSLSDFCVDFHNFHRFSDCDKRSNEVVLYRKLCNIFNYFTTLKNIHGISDEEFIVYYLIFIACKIRGYGFSLMNNLYNYFSEEDINYILQNLKNVDTVLAKIFSIIE